MHAASVFRMGCYSDSCRSRGGQCPFVVLFGALGLLAPIRGSAGASRQGDATPIPQALNTLDFQDLQIRFDALRAAEPPKVKEEPQEEDGAEPQDGEHQDAKLAKRFKGKTNANAGVKKSTKKQILPLYDTSCTMPSFVVSLADRALQFRMHTMNDNAALNRNLPAFIADAESVRARLLDSGLSPQVGTPSFDEVLSAAIDVAKCGSGDRASMPLPSAARTARLLLLKASDAQKPFNIAGAMRHHPGPRYCMEQARLCASTGLQDQAADTQFESFFLALETELEAAFEVGIGHFYLTDNRGAAHTLASFQTARMPFMHMACVEVNMLLGQWSDSRLEEKAEDLSVVMQCVAMLASLGNHIGMIAFNGKLPSDFGATHSPTEDALQSAPAADTIQQTDEDGPAAADVAPDQSAAVATDAAEPNEGAGNSPPRASVANPLRLTADSLRISKDDFESLGSDLHHFFCRVTEYLGEALAVESALSNRLGDRFTSELEALSVDLPTLKEITMWNNDSLKLACQYLVAFSDLAQIDPLRIDPFLMNLLSTRQYTEKYLRVLSAFCMPHRELLQRMQSEEDFLRSCFMCDGMDEGTTASAIVESIVSSAGVELYNKHTTPCLQVLVDNILRMSVQVSLSSTDSIDQQSNPLCIFGLIIAQPSISDLVDGGYDSDLTNMTRGLENMPHIAALEHLRLIIGAIETDHLPVLGLQLASAPNEPIPTSSALCWLTMVAYARDVAIHAACAHKWWAEKLLKNAANDEDLLKHLPDLSCRFSASLLTLDECLSSSIAKSMESQGWLSPLSFAAAQHMRHNFAIFHKRCIDLLLKAWSDMLSATSSEVLASCPSWKAAITDTHLDEDMAERLLLGQAAAVARAHNRLHERLAHLNMAASRMDLSPALPENAITKGSIAVALHTMSEAKNTSIIARGLDLYKTVKHTKDGPQKVRAFIDSHADATKSNVPASFWAHLSAFADEFKATGPASSIAASSSTVVAPPAPSAPSTDPMVKTEGDATFAMTIKAEPETTEASSAALGVAGKLKRRRKA